VEWQEEAPREQPAALPFGPLQGVLRDWAKPGPWPCTGCDGRGEVGWPRCPSSMADHAARELLHLWSAEQNGIAMLEGGKARQTRFTKQAFGIIAMEVAKIDEERTKRSRS
jgi:hypothetical protein